MIKYFGINYEGILNFIRVSHFFYNLTQYRLTINDNPLTYFRKNISDTIYD